jgi:hypothetical protein
MENKGLTLSLSGISFSMDESAQKSMIQEVTDNVLQQLSVKIEKDLAKFLEEIKGQISTLSDNLSAVAKLTAAVPDTSAAAATPAAVTAPVAEEPVKKRGGSRTKTVVPVVVTPAATTTDVAPAIAPPVVAEEPVKKRGGRRVKSEIGTEQTTAEETAKKDEIVQPETPTTTETAQAKPERKRPGRKPSVETPARGKRIPRLFPLDALIKDLDISQTLKGWLAKFDITTVKEAVLFCDADKLRTLLKNKEVNKHSMIYQLVKILRAAGYSSPDMRRFQNALEEDKKLADLKKKG